MRKGVLIGAAWLALVIVGLGASGFAPPATAALMKETAAKRISHSLRDGAGFGVNLPTEIASYDVNGTASWYGGNLDGHLDARGERFDSNLMTAAHRTLPLNSLVAVTNLENGRHVVVQITDRGPYAHRRVIDLTRAAAEALGYAENGTAHVNVRTISSRAFFPG